jgi:hypothetical protein
VINIATGEKNSRSASTCLLHHEIQDLLTHAGDLREADGTDIFFPARFRASPAFSADSSSPPLFFLLK